MLDVLLVWHGTQDLFEIPWDGNRAPKVLVGCMFGNMSHESLTFDDGGTNFKVFCPANYFIWLIGISQVRDHWSLGKTSKLLTT